MGESNLPKLTGKPNNNPIFGRFLTPFSRQTNNFIFGRSVNDPKISTDILDSYVQPVTFNFIDASAAIVLPFYLNEKDSFIPLKGLSILSISEHADGYPVTALGNKGISGFTRGHALTAGSLGFTVFDRDPWWEAIKKYNEWTGIDSKKAITRPHHLPPFDIIINFVNNDGNVAEIVIRSVVIIDGSNSMGVDTVKMSSAYSFICTGATTFVSSTLDTDGLSVRSYYEFDINGNRIPKGENANGLGAEYIAQRTVTKNDTVSILRPFGAGA